MDELNIYSSIFNEILFGKVNELRYFKNKLNEHFLFSSYDNVKEYAFIHHHLLLKGVPVEDDEDCRFMKFGK